MARKAVVEEVSRPRFLRDMPAEADRFDAHGRVADALAEVILQQLHIKMIALLGSWGSGKSTVVRLVEKRVMKSPPKKLLFFTYDTWLRQSDPPRRAFLEGLIAFLLTQDLPPVERARADWTKRLAELDGVSQTTVTATRIELTPAGRFVLPCLVFMPLGLKLIGDGVVKYGFHHDLATWTAYLLGWVLVLAPVIAVVALRIAWRVPFRELLTVFTNRPPQTHHETRTRSPDPTAIEFQAMFADILTAVRGADRRLAIVVDNLDRLPTAEAVKLWATIRSFFLEADQGGAGVAHADLPVIVVPLDPSAPGRIHNNQEADTALSQSFVEKTFDLVFHVPPPVLSSWQDYLGARLDDVFGEAITAAQKHAVTSIYEGFARAGAEGVGTTPRSLNSFANALGVLWIQWRQDREMTFAAMAYFICGRAAITEDIHIATQVEVAQIEGVDPGWRVSVAALHYGAPRQRASELYMSGPIRTAIQAQDVAAFTKLADIPGFDRYLDRVITAQDAPPATDTARLLRAAALDDRPWATEAWRRLRTRGLALLQQQPTPRPDDANAVEALVCSLPEAQRPQYLTTLARLWEGMPSDALIIGEGAHTAAVLARLAQLARGAGMADFSIPLSNDSRVLTAMLAQGGAKEDLSVLRVQADANAIVANLALQFQDHMWLMPAMKAMATHARLAPPETDWNPAFDALADRMESGDPPQVAAAFGTLAAIFANVPSMRDPMGAYREEGRLQRAWSRLPPSLSDTDLGTAAALCIAVGSAVEPNDGSGWERTVEDRPGLAEIVDSELQRLDPHLDLPWMVRMSGTHPPFVPLLRAVAAARVRGNEEGPAGAPVLSDLLGYERLFPAALSPGFWQAVARLPEFWDVLAAQGPSDAAPFYRAIIAGDPRNPGLRRGLGAKLEELSMQEWDSLVDHGGELWDQVLRLEDAGADPFILPGNVEGRLRGQIQTLLQTPDDGFRRRWFRLAEHLAAADRTRLLKALRDESYATPAPDPVGFLELAGPEFAGRGVLGGTPDRTLESILPPLLQDTRGVQWLLANASAVGVWVKWATTPAQDAAREAIAAAAAAALPQHADVLRGLLDEFGLG